MEQLKMIRDLNKPLMELPPLPAGCTVHTADENSPAVWEWIIGGSFGGEPKYTMMTNDPKCAPERTFFVKEYAQDVGTAAVQMEGQKATLHMVGLHPVGAGRGLIKHVIHAAIEYARAQGAPMMNLTTDDFRLPAIRAYLDLGFEPVEDTDEMRERWQAVRENLAKYAKKEVKVIPLWADGQVPYWQEGQCVPALTAYPVEGSRGAVVICPGGAYYVRASHEGGQIARMLNMAGISAYVLDYRVNPCHHEAPLSDASRAIRVLRSMGYEKVGILGFSAGGHLTCSAATLYTPGNPDAEDPIERLSSRPDAFVPCYPVVSFTSFAHYGSCVALLGDGQYNLALLRRFSAELNVTCDTPPAFIWHTATDSGVPVQNSINLALALSNKGVPVEMHIFPTGEHGLGLAAGNPVVGQWPALCQAWLLSQGFGCRPQ